MKLVLLLEDDNDEVEVRVSDLIENFDFPSLDFSVGRDRFSGEDGADFLFSDCFFFSSDNPISASAKLAPGKVQR